MDPIEKSRRPFQFTLREMLCMTACIVAANHLLACYLAWSLHLSRIEKRELRVAILIVTTLCVLFAFFLRAKFDGGALKRSLAPALCVFPFWMLLGCALPPYYHYPCRCGTQTAAAAACKAYAEAQEIYRRNDFDTDGVLEYAMSLNGDFSLLERTAGSSDIALVDRRFAAAEGKPGVAMPMAGYVFKVLTAQGPNATGGARSYVDEKGNMCTGYALAAFPDEYDVTGRDIFIINNNGTIFQADLGHNDMDKITEFDPVAGIWVPTE